MSDIVDDDYTDVDDEPSAPETKVTLEEAMTIIFSCLKEINGRLKALEADKARTDYLHP